MNYSASKIKPNTPLTYTQATRYIQWTENNRHAMYVMGKDALTLSAGQTFALYITRAVASKVKRTHSYGYWGYFIYTYDDKGVVPHATRSFTVLSNYKNIDFMDQERKLYNTLVSHFQPTRKTNIGRLMQKGINLRQLEQYKNQEIYVPDLDFTPIYPWNEV